MSNYTNKTRSQNTCVHNTVRQWSEVSRVTSRPLSCSCRWPDDHVTMLSSSPWLAPGSRPRDRDNKFRDFRSNPDLAAAPVAATRLQSRVSQIFFRVKNYPRVKIFHPEICALGSGCRQRCLIYASHRLKLPLDTYSCNIIISSSSSSSVFFWRCAPYKLLYYYYHHHHHHHHHHHIGLMEQWHTALNNTKAKVYLRQLTNKRTFITINRRRRTAYVW